MANRKSKGTPARCRACGGEWFREATYYAFRREERISVWRSWPELTGQHSMSPMTAAVCLCGMPLEPLVAGMRGETAGRERADFLESLKQGRQCIQENQEGHPVLAAAKEQLATLKDFQILEKRFKILQRELGRRQRLKPGKGRYWCQPERQADSGAGGTLTRDRLVVMLQKRGLQFRTAREVVRTIFDVMTRKLRQEGKVSIKSLGSFFLKPQPQEQRRTRFGRRQTLFRQRTKLAFKPSKALAMVLSTSLTRRAIPQPAVKRKDLRYACEKCGSTMFVESEFRQYVQMPSSTPGEDLKSRTEGLPIRVLICLCGHPKRLDRIRLDRIRYPLKADLASFEESLAMALQRRQGADAQVITDKLAGLYAGRARQLALVEQAYWLERMVQALPVSRRGIAPDPDAEINGTMNSLPVLGPESRQHKRNDPRLYCDNCGSTLFAEGRFRQWLKLPPLRPRGEEELSILDTEGSVWNPEKGSPHPKGIRSLACICGYPVRLGRLRRQIPGDQPSFDESFEKAIQTADARVLAERLLPKFATIAVVRALAGSISVMGKIVLALPRPAKQGG